MNVQEWQGRLERKFAISNGTNDFAKRLGDAETRYGEYVRSKYHGHRTLQAAFATLFHETLERTARAYADREIVRSAPYQPALFLDFLTNFRSFCAAETLLYGGYPLDGFGLLRDLKDEAAYIAALARGETDYRKMRGYVGDEPMDLEAVRKAREPEERRILRLTFGDDALLSDQQKQAVKRWSALFHLEVHGSRLTSTEAMGWIQRRELLSLVPAPMERSMAVYVTTTPIISWMHLRCMPFLQLQPGSFGTDWAGKWELLDESYRWMLGTWESTDMSLPDAIVTLIDSRFAFTPAQSYIERTNPAADV